MRRPLVGMLLIGAACLTLSLPSLAVSTPRIGEKSNGWSLTDETYLHAYQRCWDVFGPDCGRNLLESAWTDKPAVPESRIKSSTATMTRWLHPAPAPTVASSISSDVAPSTPAPAAYVPAGTAWDSVAACESSGDWSASTGNGYYGGLQFDSGTWDAYGDPQYAEASDAPPAAQIAAAESMPYDGWPNC
jgi:hypothetical protein